MRHAEMLLNGFFFGGPCDASVGKQLVRSPWDGSAVGTAAEGGLPELRNCVDAAHAAFAAWSNRPRNARQDLLREVARRVRAQADDLAELLVLEIGKPITLARGEVARTARTFDAAADALAIWGVEAIPLDLDARGASVRCVVERFPRGVVFAIVPYNWPLNLAAHKLAPALATGNVVVLKPSHQAPLSTLALARIVHEAGAPPGTVNAWNGPAKLAQKVLEEDRRIAALSFTGSPAVGWMLKERLPDRHVTLELGGNAFAIVAPDADLPRSARKIAASAFGYAGQVCISTQHTLVHASVAEAFRAELIAATQAVRWGDPSDPDVLCGPVIDGEAGDRIQAWVQEALDAGAHRLTGAERRGNLLEPTLLENVPSRAKLACEEAFGPILAVETYNDPEEAFARVNRGDYGIHAAVFTRDLVLADSAFRSLQVGGVVINDSPSLRFDVAPYGGVKRSGYGREGVTSAMDALTEPRTRYDQLGD